MAISPHSVHCIRSLIVVSVICLVAGGQRKSTDHDQRVDSSDPDESQHLMGNEEVHTHYESNKESPRRTTSHEMKPLHTTSDKPSVQ